MKYINSDSLEAFDYLKKYNVFLTGGPGSGKSYLINKFIQWINDQNIKVGITASTGIAAKIINGTTLHSWAGIGLAQESKEKLLEEVKDKPYKKRNWKQTQILIIDEISMISGELWKILDYIGRNIRKIDKPFGGIQILAVGDFYQLPPVRGKMLIDQSVNLDSYFDYGICLTQNYRSSDLKLNQILERIRNGIELSKEHDELLKLKINKKNVKYPILVSLRDTARDYNNKKLKEIIDIEYKFNCDIYCINKQTSEKLILTKYENLKKIAFAECAMEKELILKIGVPVIYLVNDPITGLVNGSIGTIIEFRNDNPIIQFELIKTEIFKHKFTKDFDNNIQVIVEQYPLLLAYALTIHRAQGQTLSQGTILLDNTIWEDGQAYVALSRLQNLDNLTLIKYNPKVFKISSQVKEFYLRFNQ